MKQPKRNRGLDALRGCARQSVRFLLAVPVLIAAVALCSCCGEDKANADSDLPDEAEVAEMYNHFIRGEYGAYVDQMESLDSMPPDYRSQMVALMKQRHRQLEEERGGPRSCRIVRFVPSDDDKYCEAYVEVMYNDSTYDEILLPLVRIGDVWKLK